MPKMKFKASYIIYVYSDEISILGRAEDYVHNDTPDQLNGNNDPDVLLKWT